MFRIRKGANVRDIAVSEKKEGQVPGPIGVDRRTPGHLVKAAQRQRIHDGGTASQTLPCSDFLFFDDGERRRG